MNHPLIPRRGASHRRRSSASMPFFSSAIFSDAMLQEFAFFRRTIAVLAFFIAVFFSCFVLYRAAHSLRFFPMSSGSSTFPYVFPDVADDIPDTKEYRLEKVLKDAAMDDKTVILTTLNEAWAAPNSIIDLFLESFRIGDHTRRLLNHLVIIALDQKAFKRCLVVHNHCFALVTEGVDFSREAYFMTHDYLKMMWRRIDFLRSVLEMGYNFVFTAALWIYRIDLMEGLTMCSPIIDQWISTSIGTLHENSIQDTMTKMFSILLNSINSLLILD